MASRMVLGELSFTGCRVCGWAALPGSSLCVGCLDIREWSRVNRAFCDLLHRDGTQAPGTAGSSTVATELALTA